MKSSKMKLFRGVVVAICAIAAIFGLFGNAFADGKTPDPHGSIFDLMLHAEQHGYNDMPLFGVAFGFLITGGVFGLVGAFLPRKIGGLSLGIAALFLIGAIVILLNAKEILVSAGTIKDGLEIIDAEGLGIGVILPTVFGGLGALLGAYGAYVGFKA